MRVLFYKEMAILDPTCPNSLFSAGLSGTSAQNPQPHLPHNGLLVGYFAKLTTEHCRLRASLGLAGLIEGQWIKAGVREKGDEVRGEIFPSNRGGGSRGALGNRPSRGPQRRILRVD
jgi:hypothetical protein